MAVFQGKEDDFMRIAIVDDQPEEARRLEDMLRTAFLDTHTDIHKLDVFPSAEAFLEIWEKNAYDLVLLDIFMGQMTGVEAAHILRAADEQVRLVFCTTSNAFASESYAVGASYYLHKPYSIEDLHRMITQVRPRDYALTRYILLPDGQKIILRDILYTEYDNHVISIHRKRGGLAQTRMGQAALEALVADDPYLISCSKGLLVNLYEVDSMDADTFYLNDGTRLPISRRKAREVQEVWHDFLFRKMREEMLV